MTSTHLRNNPVVTLEAALKKFNYPVLKAQPTNVEAASGATMYKDICRMNFVINGKSISKDFIVELYNNLPDKEEFFECASTEEELDKLREDEEEFFECVSTEEELKELLKDKVVKQNYRAVVKEIFREMFKYAGAQVPNDSILEELVTNCNQAGYEGALYGTDQAMYALSTINQLLSSFGSKTIHIDCNDSDNVTVLSNGKIIIQNSAGKYISQLDNSIKFTLESQDNNNIIYKNGKISLTVPKELENYKVDGKNLSDIIREYFQQFCEKLGFKFEKKIEHHFDEPSVNSSLDSVEKPINCIDSDRKAALG